MQTYQTMKDSGIVWLGAVPNDWKKTTLKYLATYTNGYAFKPTDWSDSGLPILRIAQLTSRAQPNYFDGEIDSSLKIRKGDLLFSWSASLDAFIWYGDDAWLNQHIFKVVPSSEANKKYLYYLIKFLAPKLSDIDAHGSAMRHVKRESLSQDVYVPNVSKQKKIADFLDTETAKIDNLIAKQETLLELLEEKRRATITHAVTRGLNPDVELKETDIPWLGQIPKAWNIVRVKDIANVVLGKMVQNEQKKAEEVLKPYLKSRNIQWDGIDLSNVDEMWFKPTEIQSYSLRDNDIVVSEGGDVGKCVMWQEKFGEMYFQNSVNRIRVSDSAEAKYIYYVFQHLALNQVFMNTVNKVSIAHLTKDKIVTYHIPMPAKTEQGWIADFLDAEDEKFQELKQKIKTQITLLRERRTSLISHAVTGKVKI